MNTENFTRAGKCVKTRLVSLALATIATAATTTIAVTAVTHASPMATKLGSIKEALALRLPKTPIHGLNCRGYGGLCEVISGGSLFYIDEQVRYLFVGRLYDMELRRDVTAARLLDIAPDTLVPTAEQSGADTTKTLASTHVDLGALPKSGSIRWGKAGKTELVIFTDFACSYCRALFSDLASANIAVEERPLGLLGEDSLTTAKAVLCDADPQEARLRAYAGETLTPPEPCNAKGLDANHAFAKKHGFSGTPVLVRASDGAVLHGYRPLPEIKAFLAETR